MEISVQKWGNSLAFRIPKAVAKEAHLERGSKADLGLADGQLIIRPLRRRQWTLKALLANVKKSNLHGETSTGNAAGQESW